eukprot:COSAG03_NODE_6_length_26200_cov_62.015517_6_plen_69_part_00
MWAPSLWICFATSTATLWRQSQRERESARAREREREREREGEGGRKEDYRRIASAALALSLLRPRISA